MKKVLPLILLSSILLSGCFVTDFFSNIMNKIRGSLPTKQIVLQTSKDDYPLTVEVADNEDERQTGLMDRDALDEGKGMLFVFEDEAPRAFWMKNTKIPLDIIFFNSKKQVVHVVENMKPCTTPQCVSYDSKDAAMYALEVRAGFIRAYGVKLGNTMTDGK